PQVPPDQPSPESVKIAESLIVVELVTDLCPTSALLPTDLVLRAQARLFIAVVSTKFGAAFMVPFARAESFTGLWDALEILKSLFPADKQFAVGGQFTAADIALAMFFARTEGALKNDIDEFKAGEGTKA
ncbi:hypothetical protein DFH09DRAFT_860963, partial [Mycena vulgaris]